VCAGLKFEFEFARGEEAAEEDSRRFSNISQGKIA
jgi:hypothetical protein